MKLLFILLLAGLFCGDIKEVVHNDKQKFGVDFTYHSQIILDKKNTMRVYNYLKNNDRNRPLSIRWDAAGLAYLVDKQLKYEHQIPKLESAEEISSPCLHPNTPIKIGLAPRVRFEVDCWVEKESIKEHSAFNKNKSVELRNENGHVLVGLNLNSKHIDELNASILSFDVIGGSSIMFEEPEGFEFVMSKNGSITADWVVLRDTSLNTLLKSDSKEYISSVRLN